MFLNVIMLAGIGGAVLPLVVHLMHRARYRTIDWGGMMFLYGNDARQLNRAKLQQIILLLVRMALVALLAIALARPLASGALAAMAEKGAVTVAIVIDRGASMGYERSGRTRLEEGKESALQLIASLHKGDRVALILAGGEWDNPFDQPTADLQSVASYVSTLTPSTEKSQLADAMLRATDALQRSAGQGDDALNRVLAVIADRQALSWKNVDDNFAARWKTLWPSGATRPQMLLIPVGGTESDNLAISDMTVLNPPIIRGEPATMEIRVHNFGADRRAEIPLRVTSGDHTLLETKVDLNPHGEVSVRAPIKFNGVGSHLVGASIDSTGLTFDDSMQAIVEVQNPIKVLLVRGEPAGMATQTPGGNGLTNDGGNQFSSEAEYIDLALAPFGHAGRQGPDIATCTTISPQELSTADTSDVRVIVLANVPQVDEADARALEQFVYGGGGLLVAPGNLSQASSYDDALYRQGAGILPASISTASAAMLTSPTSLLGIDVTHPIFAFLRDKPDPLPSAVVGRYFSAVPRFDAHVLASFATGAPFAIEADAGRGRVLLVTSPLDERWGSLPMSNFFLPFVQSSVRFLASGDTTHRNLLPGEPIVQIVPTATAPDRARVRLPDGAEAPMQAARAGDVTELRYAATQQSGVYDVQWAGSGGPSRFVVSPPRDDSDLTALSDQRWAQLPGVLGMTRVDTDQKPLMAYLSQARPSHELWSELLAGVLVLGVAEVGLARMWSSPQ